MKYFLAFLLLLLWLCPSHAQTIKGYLIADSVLKPVEFGNVVLLGLPDSSYKAGAVSYLDGQYTFEKVTPGAYFIKASSMGFENGGTPLVVTEASGTVWADTIFLAEKLNLLDEIVVTGDLIRAKEMVDRTVYEILPEIEKTSTNGYDVLKKIPSVQVDFQNNITLNGKSNFIIQVDGKQRDKEFLARILASDIESIEIIHNPSGKYDGAIEGVINVVIKKEARVGVNGNFGMQLKPVGNTTMGAMGGIDYGLEKITFYVSGYSFIQNLTNNTTDYRRFTLPMNDVDSVLDIAGNGTFNMSATAINVGSDYYINNKNNLSINYSYKPFSLKNNLLNNGDILLDRQIVNYQEYESNNLTKSGENNLSLFYRKKYSKPIQELIVESNYYFFNSKDDNRFDTRIYQVDRLTEVSGNPRGEVAYNNRSYLSTRVDYVQPIGVSMRFEAGYQFYHQSMDYEFTSSDDNLSNTFQYIELRNAGYASFFWNLKNFSAQATLRVENSQININKSITSGYTTLLPSTNLLYKFNAKQNIKFTYNRRINRPGIYQLNPFEKLNNNLTVTAGNPYLKPEYRDRLQLTYTLNVKKTNIAPYVYHEFYSNQADYIFTLKESPISGNPAMFNSPDNILTGYENGLGLNAMVYFFNINGSVYQSHFNSYSSPVFQIEARDYFSFRVNSYVFAPLFKKKVNAFAMVFYNGVGKSAQSKTYSPLIYGFGGQYVLKDHTFGLFYLLPLSKEIVFNKTITSTPFVYSENTSAFDASWFVQVMYSYKFNKGRAVKKTSRQTEIESDTKGGGLGR